MIEKLRALERALLFANADETNENVVNYEFMCRGIKSDDLEKIRNSEFADYELKNLIDNINTIAGYYEHKSYDPQRFESMYKARLEHMKNKRIKGIAHNYKLENENAKPIKIIGRSEQPYMRRVKKKKKGVFKRLRDYVLDKVEGFFEPDFAYSTYKR